MIDNCAGVNPATTFSSFDKHLALRTDGDKNTCRIQGLVWGGKTKKEATVSFFKCCIARQESNAKHRHTSDKLKSYECEACPCGISIIQGERKILPVNIPWRKTK